MKKNKQTPVFDKVCKVFDLTQEQLKHIVLYYTMSMPKIAKQQNISRQAVHQSIKFGESKILSYQMPLPPLPLPPINASNVDKQDLWQRLDTPISYYKLTPALKQSFENENIQYLGQVVVKGKDKMENLPKIGKVALLKIEKILANKGLSFDINIYDWQTPETRKEIIKNDTK